MRFIDKNKGFSLIGVIILIAVFALAGMWMLNPAKQPDALAAGGKQGDKIWTDYAPLWSTGVDWMTDSSGQSVFAVSFPFDGNSQPVVHYLSVNAARPTDTIEIMGYMSQTTDYQTTTAIFAGGTTNYIHVTYNSLQDAPGAKYFVIDDGAGTCGWGAFTTKPTGSSSTYAVLSGVSNLAMGATFGNVDLSGVSFPVGSRVFLVERIGALGISNANTQTLDNESGLFAATKGSPLLVVVTDTNPDSLGSGVSVHGVTVIYH